MLAEKKGGLLFSFGVCFFDFRLLESSLYLPFGGQTFDRFQLLVKRRRGLPLNIGRWELLSELLSARGRKEGTLAIWMFSRQVQDDLNPILFKIFSTARRNDI